MWASALKNGRCHNSPIAAVVLTIIPFDHQAANGQPSLSAPRA
jgi:hypothetical protein